MERNGIKKKLRRPVINSLMFFRSTVRRALEVQRQFMNKVILYTRQKELKNFPSPFLSGKWTSSCWSLHPASKGWNISERTIPSFTRENVYGLLTGSSRERKGLSAGLRRIAVWWSPSKAYAPWLLPIFHKPFYNG